MIEPGSARGASDNLRFPIDVVTGGLSVLAVAVVLAAGPFLALGPRLTWITVTVLAALGGLAWLAGGAPRAALDGGAACRRVYGALAAVVAVLGLALAWTPGPAEAFSDWLDLALLALAYVVVDRSIARVDRATARRLGWAALATLAALTAVLGLELATDQPLYRWIQDIPDGTTVPDATLNRPAVAMAALVFGAARLAAALGPPRAGPRIVAAVLAVGAGLAAATPSQSAQAGVIAGTAVWVAAALVGRRPLLIALAGLAIGLTAAALPLAERLYDSGILTEEALPVSARHRVEIWYFAADWADESPWVGHGFDASRHGSSIVGVSVFQETDAPVIPLHPHNISLQIWAELGALGVVVFALMVAAIAQRLAQARVSGRAAIAAGDVGLMAAALAMLSVAYGAWQAWWVSALILAVLLNTLAGRLAGLRPDPAPARADAPP